MHGADALKLGRFSGEIVKAVLVKGWLVKELLSPWCVAADPEPPLLLAVEEAEERKESPQLSGKKSAGRDRVSLFTQNLSDYKLETQALQHLHC